MAKIEVTVSMGLVGCKRKETFEIDEEDLEGLDDDQRTEFIEEQAKDVMFGMVEWNWAEIEG